MEPIRITDNTGYLSTAEISDNAGINTNTEAHVSTFLKSQDGGFDVTAHNSYASKHSQRV